MKKIITLVLILFSLGGCAVPNETDVIQITVTTTMIHDLVEQIGKDRVEVYGMMQAGVDPHSHKARPSDVLAIDQADIIVYNGVNLEAKLSDVFDSLKDSKHFIIKLEDGINPNDILYDVNLGTPDPHIWFDVTLWKQAAIWVEHGLSQYDPASQDYYQKNLDNYLLELEALEAYIFTEIELVAPEKRVLVTAHDAFNYFGHAYGFEVFGVQGLNSQSEAGIRDINLLADMIIKRGIRSVYSESSVPIKTVEALLASVNDRNYHMELGGELFSDSLKENTDYINTFKKNVDTIVSGLK